MSATHWVRLLAFANLPLPGEFGASFARPSLGRRGRSYSAMP
jgi:hypothetical protein